MRRATFVKLLLWCCGAGAIPAASAQALPQPAGRTVLTISGKIGLTNRAQQAVFDMDMLQALPQKTFKTQTPWEKAPIRFSGPLLRDVLSQVRASGVRIQATALNDYRIHIPMKDAQRYDVVVALKMNGEPMPVRTKGPLFIVYPFDAEPELRSVKYYERSIWQLQALTIE